MPDTKTKITSFRGETTPIPDAKVDDMIAALTKRVGDRVKKARNLKRIPRRVLSDLSGVSPRYLAQLEGGSGNISIGLLQRVALALDIRIEWLLGEEDPWDSETLKVMELFRTAQLGRRQKVLEILNSQAPQEQRAHRICLVGLRGAGKSSLGARAGAILDIPFVELNREIENQSGMPINEVMALYGQEGYRQLESKAIDRVIETHDTMILAVAGGIVTVPHTYMTIRRHFHTIWIKASPTEHMDRVKAQGDTRPMSNNPEAMEQLKSILASRETQYNKSLAQIDTSGKPLATSIDELVTLIKGQNFLG